MFQVNNIVHLHPVAQVLTPEDGQFRPKHVVVLKILKILKSDKC
jgi:hypothetical protein